MATTEAQSQTEWWDLWGKLKDAVAQLDAAVSTLQARQSYALARPNLATEYQDKMSEIESLRAKAIWVRDKIKEVMAAFGVNLSGLGVVPIVALIAWPAAAAAVAYLGSKALDLYQFSQRVDAQARLESQGVPPERAVQLVSDQARAGTLSEMTGNLRTIALVVALGGAAWWFIRRRRGG